MIRNLFKKVVRCRKKEMRVGAIDNMQKSDTLSRIHEAFEFQPPNIVRTAADISLVLITFLVLRKFLEGTTRLPENGYFSGWLFEQFFAHLELTKALMIIIALSILSGFRRLYSPWSDLESGHHLRIFVIILSAAIVWSLVTAGYNYYFSQSYVPAKALLMVAFMLLWWRPVFIILFLPTAYLLLWQFGEPALGGSIFPHKLQILRSLLIFEAAFLVYVITGRRSNTALLVVLCSFVGAAYWVPAIAKLNINWIASNDLSFIPVNAYAHGWLSFVSPGHIVTYSQAISAINWFLKAFVMIIESACLVFLFKRWLSISLLALLIVFHIAVFALYGFFFWTWIILDAALIFLLLSLDTPMRRELYSPGIFVFSILLVAFGSWWANPPKLGWYDTPLTYTYRVIATDEKGAEFQLHPRYFSPYDDVLTMSGFSYLAADRGVLTGPYGVTHDGEIAKALKAVAEPSKIFELERIYADDIAREPRTRALERFLYRFIRNKGIESAEHSWLGWLRAPQQFWSFRGELPRDDRITKVTVVEVTSYFVGESLEIIRTRELLHVPLTPEVK